MANAIFIRKSADRLYTLHHWYRGIYYIASESRQDAEITRDIALRDLSRKDRWISVSNFTKYALPWAIEQRQKEQFKDAATITFSTTKGAENGKALH